MFRSVATLDLLNTTLNELRKHGILYVEDLQKNPDLVNKFQDKDEIKKQLNINTEVLALDLWQEDSQRESISIGCSELDGILGNGFQCGFITELCGAPFSAKSQICMQLCVSVQLNKCHGGLDGRALYIDTRSGISYLRIKEIIRGYTNFYKNIKLFEDDIFQNIDVLSPFSDTEFLQIINDINLQEFKNKKQVRLIIIDSLSMPIQCCNDDPTKRRSLYSIILHKLHELTLKFNVAIVITNELITQFNKDGFYFSSAGGQYVSNYVHIKLELTRVTNEKFACRLLKSSTMPQVSVLFKVTEDGIRNTS